MKTFIIHKDPPRTGYELWINHNFIGWAYLHDTLRWLKREIENETDSDLCTLAPVHRGEGIQDVG